MNKSHLTLNPNAIPFTPDSNAHSINVDNNRENNDEVCIHRQLLISKKLSDVIGSQNEIRNSKRSDKNVKKPKPTNLTLETFIAEKLRLDDSTKTHKQSNNNNNNKNLVKTKQNKSAKECPANNLDSSAPTRKRGKEREIPKPKKPTALKKIIVGEKNAHKLTNSDEVLSITDNKLSVTQFEPSVNSVTDCDENVNYIAKRILHSKSFREYCNQSITEEIDRIVKSLLTDLVNFQDRLYAKDPIKAGVKRRLCFGFRETSKYAIVNKLKMLIIAPDIEKIETKGGLDDAVADLLKLMASKEVPIVFALNRKFLGITCRKKGSVSCVGVLQYDGSQENYKQLMVLSENGRNDYNTTYVQLKKSLESLESEEIEKIRLELPNIRNEFLVYKSKVNSINRKILNHYKNKMLS